MSLCRKGQLDCINQNSINPFKKEVVEITRFSKIIEMDSAKIEKTINSV